MTDNEAIIRDLYAASEGPALDTERFIAMFTDDGYMLDMASGAKMRGQAIGESLAGLVDAFPDVHRELLRIYSMGDVVVVELATRGTHTGELKLPSGGIPATGKKIDVPSCDVYRLTDGRIASFHCYNEAIVMLRQLGVGAG